MEFFLPGNNHLLTDIRLNDTDALMLYKTLVNNTYVTSLEMKYNEITDEGAQHIGKLLEVGIEQDWGGVLIPQGHSE